MTQIINKERAEIEKVALFYFVYLYIAQNKVLDKRKEWTNLSTLFYLVNFIVYKLKNFVFSSLQHISLKILELIYSKICSFLALLTQKSGQTCPLFLLAKICYHFTFEFKKGVYV
ncbi:hypothetical protein Trichorick_01411 (plasmid) [Candidatus Trichorickettsia mobilis]|uniref:Transposase n=1 Tax=Candidatus Trichorickettsia mobilis TaxID=1346319 RepID=A0ABZ0UV17_9RICK|nr:hypothetical protein Trichorick_01411 [Candidatus Trichorickettsia mobilis]